MYRRHAWSRNSSASTGGTTSTRNSAAVRLGLVTSWKRRSVVAVRRRANPIRSGS